MDVKWKLRHVRSLSRFAFGKTYVKEGQRGAEKGEQGLLQGGYAKKKKRVKKT